MKNKFLCISLLSFFILFGCVNAFALNHQYKPLELKLLPYKYDALEPYIDKETMVLHHDKHYKAYLDKFNDAIKDYPDLYSSTIYDLLTCLDCLPSEIAKTVKNNGGGVYNHEFFFDIMTPNKSILSGDLEKAIVRDFGSFDNFKESFKKAALVVGALSIMAPQMLINKNKINKASSKIFGGLLELLDLKITCIENGQDIQELNLKINSSIKTLKAIIYDKKEQHFYLSKEGQKNLNILVALEKLSFLINSYNPNTNTTSISDIKELIYLLKKQIVKYDEKTFNTYIENLHTSNQNTSDLFTVKFLGSIMFIKDSLSNLHKENSTASSIYRNLKKDVLGLNNIKFNSIKLSYSIRISIEVTIACFIMQYFDLHQGRWIMYTVLSLTTPFFEYTKSKAKDRVIATLIGAIFVAISFSIFKDSLIRGLIIIGAGYGNIYCKTYRQKIVAVTISAIGAAVLVDNHIIGNLGNGTPLVLSIERVLLILTGAVIALIINKFFFHYDVAKANNKLNNISTEILKDLISNLTKIFKEHNITDYVSNSYLLTSQLENTIVENKKNYVDASPDVIYDNHNNLKLIVASSIYELDKFSSKCTLDDNDTTQILKVIDNIKNNKPETYNLEDFNSLNGKILLSYLLDINEILPIS